MFELWRIEAENCRPFENKAKTPRFHQLMAEGLWQKFIEEFLREKINFNNLQDYLESVAYAGKNFGGVQGRGSGLVRGPGGGAPRTPENFRKFAKNSRRKLQKLLYFRLFCKRFSKPCVKFSRVWTKNNCLGKFWENFENFWWKFNGKIEFSSIFWKICC